jgi:hypothetical protein
LWRAIACTTIALRRSASGVAGLSINAAQLSISFDGVASVCEAQITCGSLVASERAAVEQRLAAAKTAAANGETKDRMTGS